MAQLRHDYAKFTALNTEILVMVPNGPKTIDRYIKQTATPYPILSDKGSQVAGSYFQIKKYLLAGTPSVFLVDQTGRILYAHYAASLTAEPDNQEPLDVLAQLTL
jgi:peroxiredoxin